jgi:hypothetical protein
MSGKDTAKAKGLRQRRGRDRQKKILAGNFKGDSATGGPTANPGFPNSDEILGYDEDGLLHE